MRKLGGVEAKVLKKYMNGGFVEAEDELIVKELVQIGLMHQGFSVKLKKRTAKTTDLGWRGI